MKDKKLENIKNKLEYLEFRVSRLEHQREESIRFWVNLIYYGFIFSAILIAGCLIGSNL